MTEWRYGAAMTTLILTQAEVRGLLDMEACMELVEGALRALARE